MNNSDLHIAFKIELDKNALNIGIGGCPAFTPEEIDYWLFSGYVALINQKVSGLNQLQQPFEGSNKRTADIQSLVRTDKNLLLQEDEDTNTVYYNGFIRDADGNQKRMYPISATIKFTNNNKLNYANASLISHEQAKKYRSTYNNRPWVKEPVYIMEDDSIIVFIDKLSMTNPFTLDLTYIKYPNKIDYKEFLENPEIPEYVQYEMIKLAAVMALANIESPRVQTSSEIFKMAE